MDDVTNKQWETAGGKGAETSANRQADTPDTSATTLDETGIKVVQEKVIEAIKTCYDPEIPVNIYDLGLIYEVKVEPSAEVAVNMTLTSPACPSAMSLPGEVEDKIRVLPDVKDVKVQVVWDPPWDTSKMSEAAKLQLGLL